MKEIVKEGLKKIPFLLKIHRKYYCFKEKRNHNIRKIDRIIISHLPINKRKIVFENFCGKGYEGRPKDIAEELIKHNVKAKLVWVSYVRPENLPNSIKWVEYGTTKAFKEWSTAHIWVDNVRNSNKPPKRPKQYYIQTWHGGAGTKKIEMLAQERLSPIYIQCAKQDSSITDLFLVGSDFLKKLVEKYFWYSGEIMKVGFECVPNKKQRENIKEKVHSYYGLRQNDKIILYAPTFRNYYSYNYFNLNFNEVIDSFQKKDKCDYYFIVRLHPNVIVKKSDYKNSKIIDGTLYPSATELVNASDVLISDYSSMLFDAIRLEIKSLIYAPDFDQYVKEERGLLMDLKKLPAPFADDEITLISNIKSFDNNIYINKCRQLNKSLGYVSGERTFDDLIERVNNILNRK